MRWAHPFLDGGTQMAYLANGDIGLFQEEWNANRVAQELLANGHTFDSQMSESPAEFRADMPDGSCVHSSEVMCHFISSLVQQNLDPAEAMGRAFSALPAEIVGMMVHLDEPDCVLAANINKALMVGCGNRGTYLATTSMAFPPEEQMSSLTAAPANATLAVFGDRIEVFPLDQLSRPITDVIPWSAARERILELLAEGKGQHFGRLKRVTSSLWPPGTLSQDDMMIYETLRGLSEEGLIRFKETHIGAGEDGVRIPKKFAYSSSV